MNLMLQHPLQQTKGNKNLSIITIFSENILKILGWEMVSDFKFPNKSVIIFAPHTSYWDGFYGKLFCLQLNINYKFLTKKEFFKFPLKYFFRFYGSIPVSKNKEYIDEIVSLFDKYENLHIIISPEGQLAKTDHWKKGYYYMAKRAKVPIVIAFIDYKNKKIGIKGIIRDINNMDETMGSISEMYKNVNAKYPEKFILDKRYN
ncbi:MAG: 1-acyl-sn-glycerol-3-phosphate acyltransferase [Flavobacteriaceae bacterium]|nr:1-acyl-sn-glycerol-3-phosphate acyltransferase [Flavobacteriaceae bacterium]